MVLGSLELILGDTCEQGFSLVLRTATSPRVIYLNVGKTWDILFLFWIVCVVCLCGVCVVCVPRLLYLFFY